MFPLGRCWSQNGEEEWEMPHNLYRGNYDGNVQGSLLHSAGRSKESIKEMKGGCIAWQLLYIALLQARSIHGNFLQLLLNRLSNFIQNIFSVPVVLYLLIPVLKLIHYPTPWNIPYVIIIWFIYRIYLLFIIRVHTTSHGSESVGATNADGLSALAQIKTMTSVKKN